jgi:hypothetical protein
MRLFDKVSWLKPESTPTSQFADAYDQLRQFIGDFLAAHEVASRGRNVDGIEFEDLLIGADVLFTSLKVALEAMEEAQDIVDNWDEDDSSESPEYAQALGEVMMSKKIFVNQVRQYDKLERVRRATLMDYQQRYGGSYSSTTLTKDAARLVFTSEYSIRPGGDRRTIEHPRSVYSHNRMGASNMRKLTDQNYTFPSLSTTTATHLI